jgi:hypothetical protein
MLDNNLSASELLTAFIDGELEAADTQMLFYQLANDAELQNEMQDLLAIRTGFSNSSVLPPPDLRNAILKNTVYQKGFSGKIALIPAFLGKYAFKISASVASLILIGLFSFWLVNYNVDSEADLVHNNLNSDNVTTLNPDLSENISSTGKQVKNNSGNALTEVKTENSNNIMILSNSPDVVDDEVMNNDFVSETIDNSGALNKIDFANNYSLQVLPPQKTIDRKDYINFYNLSSTFNKILEKVSFNINKQSLFSNPNPVINNENKPLVNDFSININYKLNDRNYFGVEFGREYFPMQFKGTEIINNREVEYEYPQSYNALWAGMTYTYNFDNIFSNRLTPYSKLTAGATSLGPVAKISFGTNYYLNDNIGIYAGLKYGALFYSFQNNIFITNKYGIDYGLIIRL